LADLRFIIRTRPPAATTPPQAPILVFGPVLCPIDFQVVLNHFQVLKSFRNSSSQYSSIAIKHQKDQFADSAIQINMVFFPS
jgi:hypothetical protein